MEHILERKRHIIKVAMKEAKADYVLKNAKYVNVFSDEILEADIAVCNGIIAGIGDYSGIKETDFSGKIVCPGMIDSHIHLESSLVTPSEFVKAVLPHGTTAVVTDPHEIANVCGTAGIDYMIESTRTLPVDVFFMIPSCVPATYYDESGAVLYDEDIEEYYKEERVLGLAEMMNFPGVTGCDEEVLRKLSTAEKFRKRVDGHAPSLSGNSLNAYVASGVYTDHECSFYEEALEKLRRGQMIQIREGTAARNLEALVPLLKKGFDDRCMFCTDDKHPSDLLEKGHLDTIVKRAVKEFGVDPVIALKAASYNPSRYYGLKHHGAIAPGYFADLMVIDNFENFTVETVFKNGRIVYENQKECFISSPVISENLKNTVHDTFRVKKLKEEDFASVDPLGCIGIIPGSIVTKDLGEEYAIATENDILKIAVVERHKNTGHIGLGYLKGYGLKSGAVATSISHDSHNIIVVGTNEKDMALAVNQVAENNGGIVIAENGQVTGSVVLEIAGLMTDRNLKTVNAELEEAKCMAMKQGVHEGIDPFMTLSFMSLPVIPEIKLTTRGIFRI